MRLGTVRLGTTAARLGAVPSVETPVAPTPGGGGYPISSPPSTSSLALLNRDYRQRDLPRRVTRVDATATAETVIAYARVGIAKARGTITRPDPPKVTPVIHVPPPEPVPIDATARAETVHATARLGTSTGRNAIARARGSRRLSDDEWFLMGFAAGQDED